MLEIRVIGELEIHVAGKTAQLPPGRRARALLGWLAIHPGRHARSRLAGLFWPDVLEASARASLRYVEFLGVWRRDGGRDDFVGVRAGVQSQG